MRCALPAAPPAHSAQAAAGRQARALLLEEVSESWDHGVSDKFVYASEFENGEGLERRADIEDHLTGDIGVEVKAQLGCRPFGNENVYLAWLIEWPRHSLIPKPAQAHRVQDRRDDSVFVFVG